MAPFSSDAVMVKDIFFPLTAVTVAVALIVCPTGVGALWRTAMKPPTVVCFGGRQGARAATAASSGTGSSDFDFHRSSSFADGPIVARRRKSGYFQSCGIINQS